VREAFKSVRFSVKSLELIDQCNTIVEDYQDQGLRLTLRQLYYQLVTKNVIPNVERSYKNLSGLLTDARLAGKVDWDAIEDRVRRPRAASEWPSVASLVDSALAAFRLPRWDGQEVYAELWVEKDALAGVLEPLSREHHVTLMVNRGYSSASAMYESAARFREGAEDRARSVLFYLGDHDPSGEDMVRDVRARLELFGVKQLTVEKIALTMDQVEEYKPPPNPAKMTDPRARDYVALHGAVSWEVDALPPQVLARLVRDSFEGIIDREKMDAVIAREEVGKEKLRKAAKRIEV
jgi:hypothetical protein